MIREVCSCGAEIETDLPEQVDLVTKWRRTHKHAPKDTSRDSSSLSTSEVAGIGFQPELPVFNDGDEI
jgi:hypothetical protein